AQVLLSNHLDDLHLERRIERSPGLGFGHFYSSQTLISLIGMSFEIRPAQSSRGQKQLACGSNKFLP
ncbi:hypothetical protein, partial [Polaromonas sp. YR568]|uniref:hypothetical protein n=1 Tax=Polaromonas sp. YR568 TaxID=1855301 RepID=UPI00398BE4FD